LTAPAQSCRGPSGGNVRFEDGRLCFRIATFGLAHRFQRLLEIIVRHARQNRYRYVLTDGSVFEQPAIGEFDIALVDMTSKGGVEIARALKVVPEARPVIGVGRRQHHARGSDDVLLRSFSLDVLTVLNHAAEGLTRRQRPPFAGAGPIDPSASRAVPMALGCRPGSAARVLVIDPSPSIRSQVAVALRQIDVDAEGVGTFASAAEVLAIRRYDMVIMEPDLPDGNGLGLIARLRSAQPQSGRRLPIIVLSGRCGWLDLGRAALAGCAGFLGKPVVPSTLKVTAARVLAAADGGFADPSHAGRRGESTGVFKAIATIVGPSRRRSLGQRPGLRPVRP
jgi:two-component system chemotaxis response regulator CheY